MDDLSSKDIIADVEQYSDDILRVCSYHRRDFDLVVVRSRPHEMQKAETSLQTALSTSPTIQLGHLDRLPLELMSMVLHELDVRSYFCFRQVNRRARVLSTELWEYELVSQHGLEGLRGLLRAGLASRFTIRDLYTTLTTEKCSSCASFGGHLFFFTMERCCIKCLQSEARYRVLPLSTFAKIAHVSSNRLTRLSVPTLRTVPGIYDMMETPARRPKHLIHEETATQTLLAMSVIGEDVIRGLGFMAATAYPFYSLEINKLKRGVSCKGCQIRLEVLRDGSDDRDGVFSTQSFLSHFPQCVEAQKLWTESGKGTQSCHEPEFTRRCGHFSLLGSDGLPA